MMLHGLFKLNGKYVQEIKLWLHILWMTTCSKNSVGLLCLPTLCFEYGQANYSFWVTGFLLPVFAHIKMFYEQDLVVTFLVTLFLVVLSAFIRNFNFCFNFKNPIPEKLYVWNPSNLSS